MSTITDICSYNKWIQWNQKFWLKTYTIINVTLWYKENYLLQFENRFWQDKQQHCNLELWSNLLTMIDIRTIVQEQLFINFWSSFFVMIWYTMITSFNTMYHTMINSQRRLTPTLGINTNTKTAKGPRMTGQTDVWTDILYCHSGDLTPWTAAACTARNYGPR